MAISLHLFTILAVFKYSNGWSLSKQHVVWIFNLIWQPMDCLMSQTSLILLHYPASYIVLFLFLLELSGQLRNCYNFIPFVNSDRINDWEGVFVGCAIFTCWCAIYSVFLISTFGVGSHLMMLLPCSKTTILTVLLLVAGHGWFLSVIMLSCRCVRCALTCMCLCVEASWVRCHGTTTLHHLRREKKYKHTVC